MAVVEKKIVAVQVFLRSIQAFETFAEVRQKHFLDLSKTIEKTTFDVAQSGKLLDVIDGQVWGPLCEELQSLVVSRHVVPCKAGYPRPYTTLPLYIPEALWQSIRNVSGSIAHALAKLCARSHERATSAPLYTFHERAASAPRHVTSALRARLYISRARCERAKTCHERAASAPRHVTSALGARQCMARARVIMYAELYLVNLN